MTRSIFRTAEGYKAFQRWYDQSLETLQVPFDSQTVDTPFGRTHMLVLGPQDAPPLVMVQGYGGSAPLWHKQFPDLIDHFRIYALDTVGMPGRSDPTPLSMLNDDYSRWLLSVFDALKLEKPAVMGVCLGGWIVLRLGIDAPDRLRRAVLLSPVGLARFKIYLRSGVPLLFSMGNPERLEKYAQRLLIHAFTPPGSNLEFDRRLAQAMMLTAKHFDVGTAAGIVGERAYWREVLTAIRLGGRFVRSEPDSELARFGVPALIFVGEYEAIYNPRAAIAKARRAIPQVTAEIVLGTGHAAIYDRPDVVNPRIIDFLKG